jgi:hypothetical protein
MRIAGFARVVEEGESPADDSGTKGAAGPSRPPWLRWRWPSAAEVAGRHGCDGSGWRRRLQWRGVAAAAAPREVERVSEN